MAEPTSGQLETKEFTSRELAAHYLAVARTFTYYETRGLFVYRGPEFGERAALWPKDNKNWCVSFWKE